VLSKRYLFISGRALRFSGENLVPINVTPVDGGRSSMVMVVLRSWRWWLGVDMVMYICVGVGVNASRHGGPWGRRLAGVVYRKARTKNGKDLCSWSTLSCSLRRLIREKACARSGPCSPGARRDARCRMDDGGVYGWVGGGFSVRGYGYILTR